MKALILLFLGSLAACMPASASQGPPLDMVRIPGGFFQMGSNDGERWEGPMHRVHLPTFHMDRHEVSNADYALFVQATDRPLPRRDEAWAKDASWSGNRPPAGRERLPVVLVTRDDAEAYCSWRRAHLPTTWEWERAARGRDGRAYPWGAEFDGQRANLLDKGAIDGFAALAPVDAMDQDLSPEGVLQMAGNAGEWVHGDFAEDLRAALGVTRRPRARALADLEHGVAERRGGHWRQPLPRYAAGWVRWRVQADERSTISGFRCAASHLERHR